MNKLLKTKGFTLVEVIVAVGLFITVMVIATGALLSMVNANRKARSIQTAINNIHFALDSMSRTMRVGTTYRCPATGNLNNTSDCTGGDTSMSFEASDGVSGFSGDQIVYRLNNSQIERSVDGGNSFVAVTAPDVTIDDLRFFVRGASPAGDGEQPRALIVVRGRAGNNVKNTTIFHVQTTVSQRIVDF